MKRQRLLPVVIATLALSLGPGSLAVAEPTPAAPATELQAQPYCYDEPSNPTADLSDLKARFNRSNWMKTLQEMYKRRWPSGEKLAIAQAKDPHWNQFVETRSFEAFAESMMVAIHEETHMWDLDAARTEWDNYTASWINASQQLLKIPLHDGFPRREILPLIKDNLSKDMDDIYLRDRQQGDYHFQGVTAELNAGLMGLPAATVVQDYIKGIGASNSRDIAATNLRYLLLYLRVAKDKHPAFWNKIKNEQKVRDLVLIQFLRTAYWLEKSAPYGSKLGSPAADKITQQNYSKENIAILEEFTGRKVRTDTQKNCTAS
ncbi:hypothetical protein NDR87_21785 [Nocardia sp. CDC159]|uniref:Secreted protein n=1 Tax=Nocardia pulmonis TaxID=2951408 RepID=A0A9X2EE46_9NOCA|nr:MULTISPECIES: hypothetical protein [Nocardia]MCM6776578.1 hypothetical protein [Nocardia pulmonis]MCM6789002.1 hypothetical protein [Nocardia sp. CDC159]